MAFYGLDLVLTYNNFRPVPESRGLRISVQVQLDSQKGFLEISQTETIFDLPSASFQLKTSLPYRFDSTQLVRFQALRVADEAESVTSREGEVDVSLASLAASPHPVGLTLPSGLCIVANTRVPPSYSDYLRLQFSGEHIKSYNNYNLGAYLMVVLVSDRRTLLLYKSEIVRSKSAQWRPFRIPVLPLQGNGNLQIHVYNDNTNARDSLIGYCCSSLSQLMQGTGALNTYMLMDKSGVRRSEKMSLELTVCERDTGPSFFDIIRSGCDLRPSVAVDFTASNGSPLDAGSLHYIHPHQPGPYSFSILSHLAPVALHARDARIDVHGFGARVGRDLLMSNCFPLEPTSPSVYGMQGVLAAYRKASMSLQPFGPTQYADVIYHTSKFAKAAVNLQMNAFFVLMIFTNGCQQICTRTMDALVDASFAPMAVLFVVVGGQEGHRTKEATALRAAEYHPLKHSDGRVAPRQVAVVVSSEEGEDGLGLVPTLIAQWKNMAELAA